MRGKIRSPNRSQITPQNTPQNTPQIAPKSLPKGAIFEYIAIAARVDYVQRGTANIRQFNIPFVPTTTRDAEAPFYFGGIQTQPRFASGSTQDFAH